MVRERSKRLISCQTQALRESSEAMATSLRRDYQ
jgi:hypothetical protein